MSRKHFIDGEYSAELVADALRGLLLQHPHLHADIKNKTVYNTAHQSDKHVSVISGGGAGHEPAHTMYVGSGMLAAAVSGNIFASPSVKQIIQCVRSVSGTAGTILIVKNYTGDIFHFHQAAEKMRSCYGTRVEVVTVGDDVAVGRRKAGKVGRRALAGVVLMEKILGAMAASGESLDDCVKMARQVNSGLATVGASLDHVRIPGQPLGANGLRDDIELGMGIHNEPGVMRVTPQPELGTLVDKMLDYLLDMNDEDRAFVNFAGAQDVVLMVNNLGSLSVLELSAITFRVHERLGKRGIKPSRVYSGTFITSLNGPGFSITLLNANASVLRYLDAPTTAVGWPVSTVKPLSAEPSLPAALPSAEEVLEDIGLVGPKVDFNLLKSSVIDACQAGIAAVPLITKYDTIVGDGDCGLTLQRGCEGVMKIFTDEKLPQDDRLLRYILRISHSIEDNMDGTSGAIYGLFFDGLASSIRKMTGHSMGIEEWATAAREALQTVQRVTPARSGDRTLMDALEPFVGSLSNGSLEVALRSATEGAERTKGMRAAFGRTVYVNEEGWEQVPDPGAFGVVALVGGLVGRLRETKGPNSIKP